MCIRDSINTFETSILPYEDCCTIVTPPHPKIRPELSEILEAEAGMPGLAELEDVYKRQEVPTVSMFIAAGGPEQGCCYGQHLSLIHI